MWIYTQLNGAMAQNNLSPIAFGYSGSGPHKNNPGDEAVRGLGPLPCGFYTIQPPVDTTTHGPEVMWLTPDSTNVMFGRSEFGIHGDSVINPGTASEGCIILPRFARDRIWQSGDHRLVVIAKPGDTIPPSGWTPVMDAGDL